VAGGRADGLPIAGAAAGALGRVDSDGRAWLPWIGARPIAEVTAPGLLAALRRIEARGALDTTHRALGNRGQVFRYGLAPSHAGNFSAIR